MKLGFNPGDLTDDQFLDGKLSILQPRQGYRAGTDPVLLAAACPAKLGQNVLELGCGVGTALICLNARVPISATGIERNQAYAEIARKNALRNGLEAKIYADDLITPPASVRDIMFDHVLINPPFFGDGRKAADPGRADGRQEDTPLEIWLDQALRRTKPKGYVTLIHLIERLAEVIGAVHPRAGNIEIKPLSARQNHLPKRFILRARKGSKGATTLYKPLILHNGTQHVEDKDSFSNEAKAILRHGQAMQF